MSLSFHLVKKKTISSLQMANGSYWPHLFPLRVVVLVVVAWLSRENFMLQNTRKVVIKLEIETCSKKL